MTTADSPIRLYFWRVVGLCRVQHTSYLRVLLLLAPSTTGPLMSRRRTDFGRYMKLSGGKYEPAYLQGTYLDTIITPREYYLSLRESEEG